MILTSLTKYRDLGLLLLRVALGLFFIYVHGWPHLKGGVSQWKGMGEAMGALHIHFAPVFWGFAAAFSESIGAALFTIGFLFRPACMLLASTMLVAALMHLQKGTLSDASHAIENLIMFVSLIFIGPGKYSVDKS